MCADRRIRGIMRLRRRRNDNARPRHGRRQRGQTPQGTKIVIYAGGSSEFSWVKGSEEEDVIEAIEEAYWQDTGRSLDFEIAYLGQNMKSKLQSELSAGSQVDIAISHTRGGDGIDDWVMANNQYYELTDVLYDLGA